MSEHTDLLHDTTSSGESIVLGGGVATLPPGKPDRDFAVAERSQMRVAVHRFFRHRLAAVSLVVFVLMCLLAFIVPIFWSQKYNGDPGFDFSVSPSWHHPFGTDDAGYDQFAFVLRGAQQSIKIALFIALFSTGVGSVYGAISGFYKGWTDSVLMRIADVVLTLPIYVVAAVLGANVGGGTWWLIGLIVGGLLWAYVARVVRGTVLSLREKDYVEAARALGASDWRIISRHLLPNAMGVIIVNATVLMATGILTETALSFIGFGVQPPDTSLGLLVSIGQTAVFTRPWLFWIPGLFIIIIVLSVNFIGDGLRDAFDPQQTPGAFMTLVDIGNEPLEALDPDIVLSVRDLQVQFPTEDGVVRAVRGVSCDLHRGEVLGIVGESGSGKSVTSLTIMGLLPPSAQVSGSIRFGETELVGASEKVLNGVRGKNIAMIFQDPMTSLNPVYSVGFQIAEAVRAHRKVSKSKALDRAVELLDIVGIPRARERVDSFPHEFSGGMRQRVVIAIAMANNPDVIIADEPTTALDVTVQAQVLEALGRAREATGAAMVLITHDLGVVAGQADRVLVMYAGRPVEIAKVDDVYYRPRMPYTLGLLGSIPRLDASNRQEKLTPIAGSPPSMLHLAAGCPFTPRCPLARELCEHTEPDLLPTTGPEHLAACHFSSELEGTAADDLFDTGIIDDVPPGPGPDPRESL